MEASETNLISLKFHGVLSTLAQDFEAEISAPHKAFRLALFNFPLLEPYLRAAEDLGVVFKVVLERCGVRQELNEIDFCEASVSQGELHVYPVISGGGQIGKIIAGVALIGLAISGVGFLGLSPLMTGVMGGLLLFQGVMGGKPDAPNPDEENTRSNVFSGPVNTASVGIPYPLALGYVIEVGSLVASGTIRSFEVRG